MLIRKMKITPTQGLIYKLKRMHGGE